jgi:8-oxo-dGTP diphosphatase
VKQAPARAIVPVAVGVVLRADGAVLLADRPGGKPYAGYWEFPGGKIEDGESVEHALVRELAEELNIAVGESLPWLVFDFDYPHAYVRLYFRRVMQWRGTPTPAEGQRLVFHRPGSPEPVPLLPAARPVMRWLGLPNRLTWPFDRQDPGQPCELSIQGARWRASIVRDTGQLARAVALGADLAVVPALAQAQLADLCRNTPIPLYAPDPGGPDALRRMQRLGLHGLVDGLAQD